MNNIYLKKSIISDKNLDQNAIGTYMALRSMYIQDKPVRYTSVNELCFELYGNSRYTRYTKEKVTNGLNQLISIGLVNKLQDISKTEYILDLTNLHINSTKGTIDYFVVITDDEMHKVFNYQSHIDKFALMKFFSMLIGSISYTTTIKDTRGAYSDVNNFVGFMPISYLAGVSNICESSASIYLSILEELQMIYVYRHTDLKWNTETNQISSFVNKYGRFKDKELIEYYAQNFESFTNVETVKKMQKKKDANYRRSLMQKYRCLCNGHKYDEKTVLEIYSYICLKNEETREKIAKAKTEEQREFYESKLHDVTIFSEIMNNKKIA